MLALFPRWFIKVMVVLWAVSLAIVVYEALFETLQFKHVWLAALYITAICYTLKLGSHDAKHKNTDD